MATEDSKDFVPAEAAEFFEERVARFHQLTEKVKRGDYSFDLEDEIEQITTMMEMFRPLAVVRELASRCANKIPMIDQEEEVQERELYAHWQLAYLTDDVDVDGMNVDAARIADEELEARVRELCATQDGKARIRGALADIPDRDPAAEQSLKELAVVVGDFRKVREALLKLIGARGEPFDPSAKYYADYRRKLAERAIREDRRVHPNGNEVLKLRRARRWNQAVLASNAKGRSGSGTMSARTVRRIESGERVEVATLRAVAEALGVDLLDLVS